MNIHLERYKQQIVESSFPHRGPSNTTSQTTADEDAEDAKKIVYKAGNYYVALTEKGFEVYSQYGYGGTFGTKEEAVKELNRLLHSDTF